MELTQAQIDALKGKGMSDSAIQTMAQQRGFTLPTKKLSNVEVGKLKASGLDDTKIQALAQQKGYQMPKDGVISGMFRAITEPIVTLAARPIQALEAISGASEKDQAINLPYYGRIETVKSGKDVLSDIGRAAETVATGIGGGGAVTAAKAGLKGKLITGAVQGAKEFGLAGGLTGFGQGLQDAEVQPADVAMKTLFGAGTGALLGAGFGTLTPFLVKSKGAINKITNVEEANKYLRQANEDVFKPTKTQYKNFQGKDTLQTYTDIFGGEVPKTNKDGYFLEESVKEMADKVDELYKPAAEAFSTILRNSPETVSISQIEQNAIKKIEQSNLIPTGKEQAIKGVQEEFDSLRREAQQMGWTSGDDMLPVFHADQFKDRFWGATKNFGSPESTVANARNLNTGHAFKEAVEGAVQDVGVKDFNKKLGDLIVLRNFVQDLVGKKSKLGGRMTRLMTRVAGTAMGAGGGIPGMIAGNLTGDVLARIMIDPALQPYRWLINKRLANMPKSELTRLSEEANTIIANMAEKRASKLITPVEQTAQQPL